MLSRKPIVSKNEEQKIVFVWFAYLSDESDEGYKCWEAFSMNACVTSVYRNLDSTLKQYELQFINLREQ
jgi:hypothetical protein